MDDKRNSIIALAATLLIAVMILATNTEAQCIQYVQFNNMLGDDFADHIHFYQNDNMSKRYIMSANVSSDYPEPVRIACGVHYDVYWPINKEHVERNPLNSSWGDFVFYGIVSLLMLAGIVLIAVYLIKIIYDMLKRGKK